MILFFLFFFRIVRCSMLDASLNRAHELHFFSSGLFTIRRGVLHSHYCNASLCGCECASVFVPVSFLYVISRSSSVRFRHKAQTPKTREYTSIFTISLLLVWCHCALQHHEREKNTHTHTHLPGISNICNVYCCIYQRAMTL